jgi:hypothetical protein
LLIAERQFGRPPDDAVSSFNRIEPTAVGLKKALRKTLSPTNENSPTADTNAVPNSEPTSLSVPSSAFYWV